MGIAGQPVGLAVRVRRPAHQKPWRRIAHSTAGERAGGGGQNGGGQAAVTGCKVEAEGAGGKMLPRRSI